MDDIDLNFHLVFQTYRVHFFKLYGSLSTAPSESAHGKLYKKQPVKFIRWDDCLFGVSLLQPLISCALFGFDVSTNCVHANSQV